MLAERAIERAAAGFSPECWAASAGCIFPISSSTSSPRKPYARPQTNLDAYRSLVARGASYGAYFIELDKAPMSF